MEAILGWQTGVGTLGKVGNGGMEFRCVYFRISKNMRPKVVAALSFQSYADLKILSEPRIPQF